MISAEPQVILERLLRENSLDWMIDLYSPPEEALPFLIDRLRRLETEYSSRFDPPVSFDPETLAAQAARNPHKIRAFLQLLGAGTTLEMQLMVWRILQGLCIQEVSMTYETLKAFDLAVTLGRPDNPVQEVEVYRSDNIADAKIIRHLGVAKIDGRPLFDGFYSLRTN